MDRQGLVDPRGLVLLDRQEIILQILLMEVVAVEEVAAAEHRGEVADPEMAQGLVMVPEALAAPVVPLKKLQKYESYHCTYFHYRTPFAGIWLAGAFDPLVEENTPKGWPDYRLLTWKIF